MCPFLIIANLLETLWSDSTVFSFYSFSFMVSCPLICLVTFACCMLYFKIIFRNNLRPWMLSSSKKLSVCFSPGTGGTRGPGYYLNTHNKPWNILSWATKGLDMDLCPCEDKLTSRLSLFCGPNEKVRAVQNQTESPILEVPRFWLFLFASWIFQNCHILQIGKHSQGKKGLQCQAYISAFLCSLRP